MSPIRFVVFLFLSLLFFSAESKPLAQDDIPEPLKPWVDWVLYDQQQSKCPFLYNSAKQRRCSWPSRLELDLRDRQGRFYSNWLTYLDSLVTLPGDARHWPLDVKVDGKPAVVSEKKGKPVINLEPGAHRIEGLFRWRRLPGNLKIPDDSGLISLKVNGKLIDFPILNKRGQLWLQGSGKTQSGDKKIQETLDVQVYRRVIDDIPLRVITRVELKVAGKQRHIILPSVLLGGLIPMEISSPLPARLEPDGRLQAQIRPGRWAIDITARSRGQLQKLTAPQAAKPRPEAELWVFDARPGFRLIEIEGLPAIDPSQTLLPDQWKQFPAYRVKSGENMGFKIIRRGDPNPEPDQLSLQRDLWLDFEGAGYTIRDRINGNMTRKWRLNANPDTKLGQVSIDGQPLLITTQGDSGIVGVEVRRGALNFSADSRFEGNVKSLNAVGWDQDFQNVRATLHLPPGWRLFAATGVDNVPDTWLFRWTLLDLFVVLIASLAVARLWNWRSGFLALAALALIWHEPDAPRFVWLNILAAIALLRVLPPGKFQMVTKFYRNASLLTLIVIGVLFTVNQVRMALYPQLERPSQMLSRAPVSMAPQIREFAEDSFEQAAAPARKMARNKNIASLESGAPVYRAQIDPKANIQTGPGLPRWSWNKVNLSWNGPVERQQNIDLILLNPRVLFVIRIFQVVLLWLLFLIVIDFLKHRSFILGTKHSGLDVWLLILPALWITSGDAKAESPTPELLKELQQRLLKPAECLPNCAQIQNMRLQALPNALKIDMEIHAQETIAVPLPYQAGQWTPAKITVDNAPAEGLYRTPQGQAWLKLGPGRHSVQLSGPLPRRDQLRLPFALKPHQVEVETQGWSVAGIDDNGVPENQLLLTRLRDKSDPEDLTELTSDTLPPFLQVERTLRFGLEWRITTSVKRTSPPSTSIAVDVPLLEGESVTTAGMRVNQKKVAVKLLPGQSNMTWESILKQRENIKLSAPSTDEWIEIWRADISPIWHMESTGIPVVHHQSNQGLWLPEWRPWPGEDLVLTISRPKAVEGRSLTIDSSELTIKPGKRATDSSLALTIRSSKGGQHTIRIPENARLQNVTINGRNQPIRQQNRAVTLPVKPGAQNINIDWREPQGIGGRFATADVDLASDSVNSTIRVSLGRDRWVLFTGGPRLGPAVLFWGVLLVIVLLAIGLAKIPLTPLKSWHWFLLLIGLSQIPVVGSLIVVAWIVALGARQRLGHAVSTGMFNAVQIGLVLLTLFALGLLFEAIRHGLLGLPDMQIAGNNSTAYQLNWYQDRTGDELPRAWIVSVPKLVYRLSMLAWSLWLAYALLDWLRWGWECFSRNRLWRKPEKKKPLAGTTAIAQQVSDENAK